MILLTTAPIHALNEVGRIVRGYATRWRIEEFHLTWKSGVCNVEDTQLRHADAVMVWATVLATVATRIERFKCLSRNDPSLAATIKFDAAELEAIRLLKRRHDPGARVPTAAKMTIGQATAFIAEIGGYQCTPSNGPPGSITIARGLHSIEIAADAIRIQRAGPSPPSTGRIRQ